MANNHTPTEMHAGKNHCIIQDGEQSFFADTSHVSKMLGPVIAAAAAAAAALLSCLGLLLMVVGFCSNCCYGVFCPGLCRKKHLTYNHGGIMETYPRVFFKGLTVSL